MQATFYKFVQSILYVDLAQTGVSNKPLGDRTPNYLIMKRTIFRPGVFSLFMIALMMYLSCNKQNNTAVIARQKISASGENNHLNELKWLKQPVIHSNNNKSGNYTGNILIKNYQDKDTNVPNMSSIGIAFHTFNYDGTTAAISDIPFFKSLSNDYTIFTSIN